MDEFWKQFVHHTLILAPGQWQNVDKAVYTLTFYGILVRKKPPCTVLILAPSQCQNIDKAVWERESSQQRGKLLEIGGNCLTFKILETFQEDLMEYNVSAHY